MELIHETSNLRVAVAAEIDLGTGEVRLLILDLPANQQHLLSEEEVRREAQHDDSRERGMEQRPKIQALLLEILDAGGERGQGARIEEILLLWLRFGRVHASGKDAQPAVARRARRARRRLGVF